MRAHLPTLIVAVLLVACGNRQVTPPPQGAAAVNAERLIADSEPGSWLLAGRDYREQRFSPLQQLDTKNVKELGLARDADIDTERGHESTPIVIDGTMYLTTAWSMVKAYDIRTGTKLWEYDPDVAKSKAADACCDVVRDSGRRQPSRAWLQQLQRI